MNTITNIFKTDKSWTRYLIVLFLLIASVQQVSARQHWNGSSDDYFKAEFDETKGCIVIRFMQGDNDFGPAGENGYIEYADISVGGNAVFHITGDDYKNGYTLDAKIGKWVQRSDKEVDGKWHLEIEWYPDNAFTANEVSVTIAGSWDINGVYTTDRMDASRTVKIPSLNPITDLQISIDTQKNETYLTFKKEGVSKMDTKGHYELKNTKDNTIKEHKFSSEGVKKTITLDGISDAAVTYELTYYFTPDPNNNLKPDYKGPESYSTSSGSFIVPAYPRPRTFQAEFNDVTRTVDLSWDIKAIDGNENKDFYTDGFEIQRCEAGLLNWVTITDVEYSSFKGSYTYSDKHFVDKSVSNSYSYRLRRKGNTQNHWDATATIYLSTEHADIVPSSIQATLDPNNKYKVHVTWDGINEDKLWSTGSKFLIARMNKTANTKEEIYLKKEDFVKHEYVDSLINMCNIYYYMLQVIPGGNYNTSNAVATNTILSSEIGDMKSLTVSKGYFYDRVELKWEADFAEGGFDKFIIQRKLHGADESEYQQIQMVDASASVTQYNTEDKNCVPGVIYDYNVYGVLKCAEGAPLQSKNKPTQIGFRTPTGDIYGRVTFSNGQAVQDVEVRLETENELPGFSYALKGGYLKVDKTSYLSGNTKAITLQAWINPMDKKAGTAQSIIKKENMYAFFIQKDKLHFRIGNATDYQSIESSTKLSDYSDPYVHVSATYSADSLHLYIDGKCVAKALYKKQAQFTGTDNPVLFGEGFTGNIDEVRIWDKALDAANIARDYSRYLAGNENNLIGYFTFDYSTTNEFYDTSYKGTNYNGYHGTIVGDVTLDADHLPTPEQLGYKGFTSSDGSYTIHAVPYTGNGTSYSIIPRMGIHTFAPTQEVRIINADAQNHTVNFTDKSSFNVQGFVTYNNSTIPVEGVMFTVDGVTVVRSNGTIIQTDNKGEFSLSVPVGTHEVKAVKSNHVFVNEGRITNSDGTDRNYQDDVTGLQLKDSTTVRYVGRIAGGTVQEAYPIGHSLSKNNLADGIALTLQYVNDAYKVALADSTVTLNHFKPSNKDKAKQNDVKWTNGTDIVIYPNAETGEFVADIIPEKFSVSLNVPGKEYESFSGGKGQLDLSNSFVWDESIYEYKDSVEIKDNKDPENPVYEYTNYSDTVRYNKQQLFIARSNTTLRITQQDARGDDLKYMGNTIVKVQNALGEETEIPLWNEQDGYLLKQPVFEQGAWYKFQAKVFEAYPYYQEDGSLKESVPADEVAVGDAKVTFSKQFCNKESEQEIVECNENGLATFEVQALQPDFTTGESNVEATFTIGDEGTSKAWPGITAYFIGYRHQGNSFVTEGPDKIMFVLRDPPGSKSYAYLEKGSTVKKTSAYHGSVTNTGSESHKAYLGGNIITFTGVGTGMIQQTEVNNDIAFGGMHEEQVSGIRTKEKVFTTNTRFQTSDDPLYVGAGGDMYVGYSTNIVMGKTENLTIRSKEQHEMYKQVSDKVIADIGEYVLVKTEGLGISERFSTLFAYPQLHIEGQLIPNLIELRNKWLVPYTGTSTNIVEDTEFYNSMKKRANTTNSAVYASYVAEDHPDFGKSNDDTTIADKTKGDPEDVTNGPSYLIIYPEALPENKDANGHIIIADNDTINIINQSIKNWEKQLRANELAKVKAKESNSPLQNYSFHAGSNIEFSESFTNTAEDIQDFHVTVGFKTSGELGYKFMKAGTSIIMEEEVYTEQGGTWSQTEETNQTQGFVFAEDGDDDYLTVDVYHEVGYEKDNQYIQYKDIDSHEKHLSTMIFITRAGATGCPYEGEYVARYYEPEKNHVIDEATLQIEMPKISLPKGQQSLIENVPSGKSAYLPIVLTNESAINEDGWYDLKILDDTNPDGAQLFMDGAAIGNGRSIMIPAEGVLNKTLEIRKGKVMNYDNLQVAIFSQCQCDPTSPTPVISDTLNFSVHFTPSCSDVNIKKPSNNWTYNTKLPTTPVNGVDKHYMDVVIDGFDVNYDNFHHLKLQYKAASGSDDDWDKGTLMNFYNSKELYDAALNAGISATMIEAKDAGTINYRWFLDDMPDQRYDLRVVSVCLIDNVEVENVSETRSGIKDMYCPRLFGSAQPANGILTINDEVRLNFNETISDGLLTVNNFQVTGVRNGTQTDHSTSVRLDGINDYFESQFNRNWNGKDITVEMWVLEDKPQNAVFFSQGNKNESLEFGITEDNKLKVKVGSTEIISQESVPYDQGTWAHVAMVLGKDGHVSAYYNFTEYISNAQAEAYTGEGNFVFGRSIATESNYFAGKMHNARIWDTLLTSGRLQTNSLNLLSGTDNNLLAYYPMNEAKGSVIEDKARGANLEMNGGEWALPEGRAASFNGNQYLEITTATTVLTSSMDYTIEFWFKGEPGQTNATLVASGRGDGLDMGGSDDLFFIGFEEGTLTFRNNEVKATADGDYLDNNWHHFALAVNRTTGRAQILVDGNLNTYFEAQDLGGIAAAKTYLGARVWTSEEDVTNAHKDYFFKGSIDDFRFWSLYKGESLVSKNNNERLDGTEKGLLAYYPFEYYITWQGTKELKFTLADQKVQADPSYTIPEGVVNEGDLESADAAPVKDKGPVANLLYDFVVNDDALIINLNEPWEKVEKTIVTFTVDGVRDVNGNEIVSPVTWSTYVDRNQLKWSDEAMNIEKKVNEPLTFSVQAMNLGGSIQHFTIENMPSWMDITPVEGTINPKSNLDITFTIDEGLNIGSYDEVIYMRNDNNVSEALAVNIKVNGEKPNWSVNPKEFKYNMNVYGKLRINSIFSVDNEDMLAAFSNGKCVGVANNQYLKVNDMWYAFLTVYSNEKTADLEFRIWDASTGKTYMATPSEAITFVSDAVKGSAINPLIFDAKEMMVQNVTVDEGWNWVSFNVATESLKNVQETLKNNEWADGDFVKDETNGKFVSYLPETSKWLGTMTTTGFDNKHMYLIKSSKVQTVSVTGTPIKSKENLTLSIGQGWNYISYLPTVNLTLKEALAGYDALEGDIVKGQNGFSMFGGNLGWLGNLTYLEAGKGYMLHRGGETTSLVYPSVNSSKTRSTRAASVAEDPAYENKQYAQNMSVIATVNGITEANDRILAYAGNELRGIADAVKNPSNDSILYFININGDAQETISFALERNGKIIAQTDAEFDYSSNTVKGSIQKPYALSFMTEEMGRVYPNPFEHELHVEMSVEPEAVFYISLNDISGRLIRQYDTKQATNGYIRETLKDLEGLASGIYLLNVKVNGTNNVYKVEKK